MHKSNFSTPPRPMPIRVPQNMGHKKLPQGSGPSGRIVNMPPSGSPNPQDFPAPPACSVFLTYSGLLNLLTIIIGAINISIIGYNFAYYKGSYRTTLFHSEMAFLVVISIGFSTTCLSLISTILTRHYYGRDGFQSMLGSFASGVIVAFGAMILLIQLAQFGRYFVEQYEVKVFCGILGLIQAFLYGLTGYVQYKQMHQQ